MITLSTPIQPPTGPQVKEIRYGLFIDPDGKRADLHILGDTRVKHVLLLWQGADYDTQIALISSAAELEAVILTRVSAANASGELSKCFAP